MKKIELIENYFGSNVVIDNESLYTHKGDQRDPKIVDDLKKEILHKMSEIYTKFDMDEWYTILEIMVSNLDEYEFDHDNSKGSFCRSCDDYNKNYIYIKKDETES
jgi:hypothetical protein